MIELGQRRALIPELAQKLPNIFSLLLQKMHGKDGIGAAVQ